jgi:ATP:ADP antiporter, AAA family
MAKRRLTFFLSKVARLRPGESRLAFLLFGYFFSITAPFAIVKSIRDASYLEDLGPESLPYAYATAILIGAVVALHARLQDRLTRRALLAGSILFYLFGAILFELLFAGTDAKILTLVYWFWANTFVVVLTTQFWILVNDIFNPRDAKRLIGFFGSGGILGGIAGGLLTGFLARPDRSHELLFLVAGLLVLSLAFVRALFAGRPARGSRAAAPERADDAAVGFGDCFRTVRTSDYLRLLAAVVFIAGIVSTFIDWQSKTVIWYARTTIADSSLASLTAFFGFFNSGLQVLAFLLQLVLTSRFIERFGIGLSFMIYPFLLLLGFGGIAVWPALIVAVLLKGGDKALSYSIQQSSRELLYIPVPPETKYRAKIFIDMFLNRAAKVAGGVILFLLFIPFKSSFRPVGRELTPQIGQIGSIVSVVSAVAAVFILAWLYLSLRVSRAYVREVKDNLPQKWERGDVRISRALDEDAARLVVDALESRRESPELFALHLYELARENKLTPEVADLLAVSDFGPGRSPGLPFLDGEEGPYVPAFESPAPDLDLDREVREILALEDYQALMTVYADRVLAGPAAADETARMELAKSIGFMDPASPLVERLDDLLADPSSRVFHYAADSAGKLLLRSHVPALLRHLADPRTADDARSALARFGPLVAGTLADMLLDAAEPEAVRREAARLLGRTDLPQAARDLLSVLDATGGPLEADILDALDALRSRPSFPALPEEIVLPRLERALARIRGERSVSALLPAFKLLGLAYDHEDVFRAYQNLLKGTKDAAAYAIELLDQMLAAALKPRLFPLIEAVYGCEEKE